MLLRSRISHGFPTIAVFKRPRNTHSADDFTFFKKTNSLLYTTRPLITRGLFYDVISTTESCLTSIHNSTCLPWWAVISGTTLLLRSVLTVPLAVYQQKIGARIELLKPLISEYAEAIKHNVVVKCRREDQPVEEANRRIRKEVCPFFNDHTFPCMCIYVSSGEPHPCYIIVCCQLLVCRHS